ncbi:putative WD repeat domain-containing protein [Rosellinia necatrix]|uniref:Putative WD repeat domain-containing protein n=1 Tax=Rosellinia necatrix TaxID=77044 RepID=A0A1W2TJU3_ROSNE|nr:putative WD repeat domain-containing protein [Rosellinia necatrix]
MAAQYSSSKLLDRPEPGLIKWSPNPGDENFLHVNLQHRVVQLYKPTGYAQRGRFDYERVAKLDDIPPLSTYDWSAAYPGLVAIGTASGAINILNLNDNTNHYLEQKLKITRFCQAIAFNSDSLLAVGLERVRNDHCLQIWDITRLTDTRQTVSWPSLDGSILGDPKYRLEPSTTVSSTRFFEDNPEMLVIGIKNQGIRIYDLRDPNGAAINYHTKCNNNLAIDYGDSNYFASSSLDRPGIVIWDRRVTPRSSLPPSYADAVETDALPWGAALRLDKAIDINPSNVPDRGSLVRSIRFCRDHRGLLAVLSRTGQLRVLETRKEFVPKEHYYEKSPELLEARNSYELDMGYAKGNRKHDQIVSFDWVTLDSPTVTPRVLVLRASGAYEILEKPSYTSDHVYKMVPWQAPHRGLEEGTSYHTLMRFDAPQYSEMMGSLLVDDAVKDIPLFGDMKTSVEAISSHIMDLLPPEIDPVLDFEAKDILPNSFTDANTTAGKILALRKHVQSSGQPRELISDGPDKTPSDATVRGTGPVSNRQAHENLLSATLNARGLPKEVQVVINHAMLLRSKEKYLFDYSANVNIVAEDPWLKDLWHWVTSAANAAYDDGMIAQGIDYSFLGVIPIWTKDLGRRGAARLSQASTPPDDAAWERGLKTLLNMKAGESSYGKLETKMPARREAAMRVCEWGKKSVDSEWIDHMKVPAPEKSLFSFTRAAARALFEGDFTEAVSVLKAASADYPELLFVSLALQLTGRGDKDRSQEQLDFDDTVASTTDPYLRAISCLIATNDWEVIANQESLPLRERTYIALRNFDDDKLTQWLDNQLKTVIETGDVEGIVLTGITDDLVDIFAKYIEKFNDVQTATLVLSICAPRYINDYRCTVWRNAYRAYLQRHKAFLQRTKFEVESTKKSKHHGVPTIKPPSRQIALRCVYCDAEYELASKMGVGMASASVAPAAQSGGQSSGSGGAGAGGSGGGGSAGSNPLMATSIHAGVSCPNCGRHLPRCVVCLEVVGIPRSDKPELSSDPQVRLAAKFPTFCLKCDHVLHLDHARQWFARHAECPVPECRCRCNFKANPELNYH